MEDSVIIPTTHELHIWASERKNSSDFFLSHSFVLVQMSDHVGHDGEEGAGMLQHL